MENSAHGKKIKVLITVAASIIVIVIAVALMSYFKDKSYDTTWTGNSSGNIANGGVVVMDGDTLYFATSSYLYRVSADGTCTKLTDYNVTSMAVYNGYIYYVNYDDNQTIYRMNLETLTDECISTVPGKCINVVEGVLYYASLYGPEYSGIYKIDLTVEGSLTLERISKDWADNLLYYNQRLYFINAADLLRLYSISLDGSDRAVSTGSGTAAFMFYEGKLYYCNVHGVFKCSPDGSSRVTVSDRRASALNMAEGYLYCCYLGGSEDEADQEFYRIKMDGSTYEQLTKDSAARICFAGGYVYFEDVYKGYDLYRISMDNKVFEKVSTFYMVS